MHGLEKIPIKFINAEGICTEDKFDPSQNLSQTLKMQIELPDIDFDRDMVNIMYMGQNSQGNGVNGMCTASFGDGSLTVRGTTEKPQYSKMNSKTSGMPSVTAPMERPILTALMARKFWHRTNHCSRIDNRS